MGGPTLDVNHSEIGQSLDSKPIDPDYDGESEGSAYDDEVNKTGNNQMVNDKDTLFYYYGTSNTM